MHLRPIYFTLCIYIWVGLAFYSLKDYRVVLVVMTCALGNVKNIIQAITHIVNFSMCWIFLYIHWFRVLLTLFAFCFVHIIVATTVGTVVAYVLVPMQSLGQDGWKIAAALMGRHIGGGNLNKLLTTIYLFGCDILLLFSFIFPNSVSWLTLRFLVFLRCCVAVNYVAISEALGVSPSVLAAGLAADNVICAVYFTTLFALASKIPPETSMSTNGTKNYKLLWLTLSLW